MIFLYRILYLPALILALPYYLFRMWRRGGYRKDFQHRFGRFRRIPPASEAKKRIWLQAVSVGEVLAVGPLMRALQESGRFEIVLTTTTSTGYAEARKRYSDQNCNIGIFPLDFWPFSRLAWKRIQPDIVMLTEGELWPEHLHQAKIRGVPCYLVNARMSDTSFRRYARFKRLASRLLNKFRAIYAASEHDAVRLEKLGADPKRVHRYGSIKLDVPRPQQLNESEKAQLLDALGFRGGKNGHPIVLLGSSTWPGEETALLKATTEAQQRGIDLRLLLVPRHAERGASLKRLLEKQSLPWHQRSTGTSPTGETIIHLADTTGELSRLTQIADFAFIGKSLPPNKGGQTPIEAAGLGVPLLMGPEMSNFRDVTAALVAIGAARIVEDASALEEAIHSLLHNPEKRTRMGEAGSQWHRKNRGSCQRIAESIIASLN